MKRWLCLLLFCGGLAVSPGGTAAQDEAAELPPDHPEMKAAIRRARARLSRFWRTFKNPKPYETYFSVKVALQDGAATEHLWLISIERQDGQVSGTVASKPEKLTNVSYGDRIVAPESDISDWSYSSKGKLVGNETIRPLLKRMSDKQARAWKDILADP